jgi:hypothetical protein
VEAEPIPPLVAVGQLHGPAGADDPDAPIFESVRDLFDRANLEDAVRRKVAAMRTRIEKLWPGLSPDARAIVERIAEEEAVTRDLVAAEWIVQRALFLEIGRHFDLERVATFAAGRADCFLALTERGSLITASEPDRRARRHVEYIRIPSRAGSWQQDVSVRGAVELVRCGHRARLPGMRTSPVQYILVVPAARRGELGRIVNLTRTGIRSTLVGNG